MPNQTVCIFDLNMSKQNIEYFCFTWQLKYSSFIDVLQKDSDDEVKQKDLVQICQSSCWNTWFD